MQLQLVIEKYANCANGVISMMTDHHTFCITPFDCFRNIGIIQSLNVPNVFLKISIKSIDLFVANSIK